MSQPKQESLVNRTSRAATWTVGGKLFSKLVDFGTLLILARMLSPADFGLIAIAMAAVFIVEAVLELPLSTALIRLPEATEEMFETALTLGMLRGLLIALILGAASVVLAKLYDDPRLIGLISALALAPIMRGLISPRMVLFAKRFDFRPEFALDLAGKMSALIMATVVAVRTESYWAIAAGTITTPTVMMLVSYILAPQSFRLHLKQWPVFADMLGWNTLFQCFNAASWQIDNLLLGHYVGPLTLGQYSTAKDLTGIPYQAIVQPLSKPLTAALATFDNEQARGVAYCKASAMLVILVAPILVSMSVLSNHIIDLLFGAQWSESAIYLQWVALLAAIGLITVPSRALVMVMNKTRVLAVCAAVELTIKLPLMIGLIHLHGIHGAIVAQAISAIAITYFTMWTVRKISGLSIYAQIAAIGRPGLALAPFVLALNLGETLLADLELGHLQLIAIALVFIGSYGIYLMSLLAIWWLGGSKDGAERIIADRLKSAIWKYFRKVGHA